VDEIVWTAATEEVMDPAVQQRYEADVDVIAAMRACGSLLPKGRGQLPAKTVPTKIGQHWLTPHVSHSETIGRKLI